MLGKRSHTTSAGERGRLSANLAVERAVRRKDGGQLSEFAHRLSSVLMHRLRQSKCNGKVKNMLRTTFRDGMENEIPWLHYKQAKLYTASRPSVSCRL